ncbi:MAG TPA: MauE/DoxX family redox-associated membrane protein [Puia sp.]|nr:MauE/DoxX family redox-associated membrane protein [Puia sp.]
MKKAFWINIITWFFIILFTYTGVTKLTDMASARDQLVFSPLPTPLASIIAWALPIGELLLAIALLIPAFRLKALYATGTLMTSFAIYVLIILSIDDHISCGCGGIVEELSPKQHVLFNSACVFLSVIAIMMTRRQRSTPRFSWLTGTSVICLLLAVGWTLFTAFTTPGKVKTGMEGSKLPAFNILLVDSTTTLNSAAIPGGAPFIIFRFEPWCPHCQAETRDIIQHMQQLKNIRIYYITSSPFAEMKVFYQHYKLAQYPNIFMGRDTSNYFLHYYKPSSIPYLVVFDAKKRLVTAMKGETDIEYLRQVAFE